jgi:4-hydroxy-tetrahydrodipicolinate reductase
MKRIALIGNGKTGSKVAELAKDYEVVVFDSKNKVSVERLLLCDVAVVFVSGDVFVSIIPLLLESQIPVVSGSTGFDLPDDLEEKVLASKSKWVLAANFSLIMNVVQSLLESLKFFK